MAQPCYCTTIGNGGPIVLYENAPLFTSGKRCTIQGYLLSLIFVLLYLQVHRPPLGEFLCVTILLFIKGTLAAVNFIS